MPIDTAQYFADYNADAAQNQPQGSDSRREGDNQIRDHKKVCKDSFPNIGGAVTSTHEQLNSLSSAGGGQKAVTFDTGNTVHQLFYRAAAPTGWTIEAAVDEHSVRLTSGTSVAGGTSGGTYDFSTLFNNLSENDASGAGVGGHGITEAETGPHTHTDSGHIHNAAIGGGDANTNFFGNVYFASNDSTGAQLGKTFATGSSNVAIASATANLASAGSGSDHYHSVDLRAKWAACIIASLD